jgi:phosphoribosylamine--glycine ligase
MKLLVVGGGAREHALAWRLARDRGVAEVLVAPGNVGVTHASQSRGASVRCVPLASAAPDAILSIAERERVDLTIVGPELPLERGIVDLFASHRRRIFGPTRAAAALETSKVFAKAFMLRHGVPTARSVVCESAASALDAARRGELGWPLVVKADGLAAGKGVTIARDLAAAEGAIRDAMIDRRFGDAGAKLLLEECMRGIEASFFAICDGRDAVVLPSAQDHKRVYDDDEGPNTGGMGAFAPSPLVTQAVADRVTREIIEPVLAGMREERTEYRGFLYAGLMLTDEGPKVVEFNVRFGDPEAQVVLPLIDGELSAVLGAAADGELSGARLALTTTGEVAVGVVLASGGYPGDVMTGFPIEGLEGSETTADVLVFHASTAERDGRIVTNGGRVLTVVGRAASYEQAIDRAYAGVRQISFQAMHYRRDIGRKALGALRDA